MVDNLGGKMTRDELETFKKLTKHRRQKLLSTLDDRELLRRISWNEGIERTLVDLEDFLLGKISKEYLERILDLEKNNG